MFLNTLVFMIRLLISCVLLCVQIIFLVSISKLTSHHFILSSFSFFIYLDRKIRKVYDNVFYVIPSFDRITKRTIVQLLLLLSVFKMIQEITFGLFSKKFCYFEGRFLQFFLFINSILPDHCCSTMNTFFFNQILYCFMWTMTQEFYVVCLSRTHIILLLHCNQINKNL